FRPRLAAIPHDEFLPVGPDWAEDEIEAVDRRERGGAIVERLFSGAAAVADDLLRAPRPDHYVFDHTMVGGPIAATRRGVRWTAVYGLTVPFRPRGWPPFGSDLDASASPIARVGFVWRDRVMRAENRRVFEPLFAAWRAAGRD